MVDLLGLSLVFFSALVAVVSYEYSAEECRSLGFNRANLLCSSCNYLEEFDLSALENECRACCQQEGKSDAAVLYPQAILEVCGWKLGSYPQVQAFIKSDKARGLPNLKIKYVRGADPIIKLLDDDGVVKEELAIDKWNTDSVEEFLTMHLIMDQMSNDL